MNIPITQDPQEGSNAMARSLILSEGTAEEIRKNKVTHCLAGDV